MWTEQLALLGSFQKHIRKEANPVFRSIAHQIPNMEDCVHYGFFRVLVGISPFAGWLKIFLIKIPFFIT
jgi:hypothetical protein